MIDAKLLDLEQRGLFVEAVRDDILSLIDGIDPTVNNNNKLFLEYDGPGNLKKES